MTTLREPEPRDDPPSCPKCGITYRLTPGGLCWVCEKYSK
jgi:hypothetical protein